VAVQILSPEIRVSLSHSSPWLRVDGVRCWCENGGCLGSFSFMVAAWCDGGCVRDVAADARTVIAERERSCWTREEDGFAVLVLLLRFPWLLREEEELAVAQGVEMVVTQIPAKCCRFVAVCSRWRSAREDGGVEARR